MLPKFNLPFAKMKATDAGRAAGHNCRLHPTESQLPKSAWFTPQGNHEVMAWRPEVLEYAKGLMKRKDAVVAISFSVQVGKQQEWREKPTEDCPEGRPRPNQNKALNALIRGAKEWAIKEFGEENIVGINLHTDESTPHIHVVVTPVRDGKLQAKAWLDGSQTCAQLRRRAWEVVNTYLPCTYTPGAAGGAPHDADLAAGKAGQLAKRKAELDARERALAEREANVEARDDALWEREPAVWQRERAVEAREKALEAMAEEVAASTPAALKEQNKRLRAIVAAIPEAVIRELPNKELRQAIRRVQEAQQDNGLSC